MPTGRGLDQYTMAHHDDIDPPLLKVLLLTLVALTIVFAFPYAEATHNANERPRLVQGLAILERGELAIDGGVNRNLPLGPDVANSPKTQRVYPNKPPTASVASSIGWAIHRIEGSMRKVETNLRGLTLWSRIVGAALPTMLVLVAAWINLRNRYDETSALLGAVMWAFATPAFAYAHVHYGHAISAMFLFIGTVWLLRAADQGDGGQAFGGGLMAGLAVSVDYAMAFTGLPIGIAIIVIAVKRDVVRVIVPSLLGALIPIAGLAFYHWRIFGSPFATGYHHAATAEFAAIHGQGLLGLHAPTLEGLWKHLFAPGTGLFYWSPLVLAGLVGLGWSAIQDPEDDVRWLARTGLAIVALMVALGAGLAFDGGWRIGPRYLVPVLPFLIPGFVRIAQEIRSFAAGSFVVAMLAGWSVVANVLAGTLWPHVDMAHVRDPLGELLWPLLRGGYDPYSLAWLAGIDHGAVIGLALGVGTFALLWFVHSMHVGPAWLATLGGLAVGGWLSTTTHVWIAPHADGPANLEYVERVWEPKHLGDAPQSAKILPRNPATMTDGARRSPSDAGRL